MKHSGGVIEFRQKKKQQHSDIVYAGDTTEDMRGTDTVYKAEVIIHRGAHIQTQRWQINRNYKGVLHGLLLRLMSVLWLMVDSFDFLCTTGCNTVAPQDAACITKRGEGVS